MELMLKTAQADDLPRLADFYRHVIADTVDMQVYTRWKYGLHPRDELILEYISRGEMFYLEQEGSIAAAAAMAHGQDGAYLDVEWAQQIPNEEIAVLHILGVAPELQRRGLAERMLRLSAELAREWGCRSLRLDTLGVNTVAQHLYGRFGFELRGRQMLTAANTGLIEFLFYELAL